MRHRPLIALAVAMVATAALNANAQTSPPAAAPAAPPAAAPPPLPPPVPFDQALLLAANDLFTKAALRSDAPSPVSLAIDPLIDGNTGMQSTATQSMGRRITELVRKDFPRYRIEPFNTATVAKSPLILVGTFTPISLTGKNDGPRDAFRVCLALLDLASGKIISKGFARATPEGIDHAPVAFFNDSPVWTADPSTQAYIKSCQGTKAGDPINQAYADRVLASAFLSDAINAYNGGKFKDAIGLYQSALKTPGGDQLRTHNGIYLTSLRLNRKKEAADAFAKVVDAGLENKSLAVKFLFKPGSTQLYTPAKGAGQPYPMWISTIASKAAARSSCLEVVGHSSATGPEPINIRLSTLRAETIKDGIAARAPALSKRLIANGVGSKEVLVGTRKDNASDALDRRVEFKVIGAC